LENVQWGAGGEFVLTVQNIEAELSYAYLHAVASRAGISEKTGRGSDDAGVDAVLRVRREWPGPWLLTNFTIDVQLKATTAQPAESGGRYSFPLKKKNYNELRSTRTTSPQVLVVLFLPANDAEWLVHCRESLVARRCAYWLSLYGAPASENETSQTVYIPTGNLLSVENLGLLMNRLANREKIVYDA
jgi:hypothetical protein